MSPKMPAKQRDVFVPTLNRYGYMLETLDPYTQAFVDFSAACEQPVVDIGAAYGVAALPALERGAHVIAVDLDQRHLDILRSRAPAEVVANLTTLVAEFPEHLPVPPGSIGAFLMARVAHFFTPARLELAAAKTYDALAPGGKLFLTAETPYLKNWRAFHPVYDQRRSMGEPWPGFVEDVSRYLTAERADHLPASMMLLDPDMLRRVFSAAGFTIEKLEFLPRPEFPDDMRLDGRESVGLIAAKPEAS